MVERLAYHPDWEELLAYGQGRLDPTSAQALEDHLIECRRCCDLLETAPADNFLGRLRDVDPPSMSQPPEPAIPAELIDHPRYRVLGVVGQGGMGTVYRAVHRRMERVVALKVMRPNLMRQPSAVQRFQQEARAAARLHHPNIVTAYDADQAGDLHFLVMEHVEGRNLADYLHEKGPLPVAEACRHAQQTALGLQHAHEQGMVHRDIKPHNLMLQTDGTVKILDFGLARLPRAVEVVPTSADGPAGSLTATNTVMGTADYIAPEQAADPRSADIRADLYALGCTLFHLLCGCPPFPEGTVAQKLARHAGTVLPSLTELRPEVPRGLDAILQRLTAKEPGRRYSAPAEVADALAPFCVPRNENAPRTRVRRRWRALAVFSAIALLLGAIGLPGWLLRPATSNLPTRNDDNPLVSDLKPAPILLAPAAPPLDPAPDAGGIGLDDDPAERDAIALIKKHNGFVVQDSTRPTNPVIEVGVEGASFSDAQLRQLASLTQVRKMYVGRTNITGMGFEDLTNLKKLTELDVSQSTVDDTGLTAIARLTSLKILRMSGTKVTDGGLRQLAPLKRLEELSVSGSRFGDTAALHIAANLRQLKRLYFDNSGVGDVGVKALAELPDLQFLTLNGTRVRDEGLQALTKSASLEELHLSFNDVTDQSAVLLSRCQSLRVLNLFHTSITDKGLEKLGTLPRLRDLDLRGSDRISMEALTAFIRKHPQCSVKR